MSFEVTFAEEQQIKLLANQLGIDLTWTKDGKLDPALVAGFRVGGLLGKEFEHTGDATKITKVVELFGGKVTKVH